jgi:2-phosphoglycerate kinase
MQVDDLRLALQYSQVTLPERTDQLYWFERTPEHWMRPVGEVRQAFIDVAAVMAHAVRTVIDSHVVTGTPMVIEGDGIHPSLAADPVLSPWRSRGNVRFCCITSAGTDELADNMVRRGRGNHLDDHARVERMARANFAFNHWLAAESRSHGIPVVQSQPFASLAGRILAAVKLEPSPGG